MKISITGNTYPVKDKLKAIGGTWDANSKSWMVPEDRADEARQLVANTPKGFTSSSFRHSRCKECGCAPSQYNKIYRNGLCKDCYVSEKEEREMGY